MKFHRSFQTVFGLVAILAISLTCAITQAGTFHWGDFAGDEVMFLDVTEDNDEATSLFAPEPGMGGPMVAGNSMHLDPQGFSSQSSDSTDLIDSTLSTVIMAGAGNGITSIDISEFGDYSLGDAATVEPRVTCSIAEDCPESKGIPRQKPLHRSPPS